MEKDKSIMCLYRMIPEMTTEENIVKTDHSLQQIYALLNEFRFITVQLLHLPYFIKFIKQE